MNKLDLFKMAANNLWRRKLRTSLTILGVIIGTASIVVMMSLGYGMKSSQEAMFSQFGDITVISVYPSGGGGGPTPPGQRRMNLDKNTLNEFKNIKHVAGTTPVVNSYGKVKTGKFESYPNIMGVDVSSMEAFEYKTSEGRLLNRGDRMTKSIPVVIGHDLVNQFFNPKARVFKEPEIDLMKDKFELIFEDYSGEQNKNEKKYPLNVVGVLQGDDYETSSSVFMSFEDLEKLNKEQESSSNQGNRRKSKEYQQVKVKASSREYVTEIQAAIDAMGFNTYSQQETLETFEKETLVMQAVLGGIGAISLIVAAIGITNTMIMSIYERTKEIGIMKVVGASIQDIKRLFLVEASYIGLLGGLFGLGFSYLISYFLNQFSGMFSGGMGMGMGAEGTRISIIPPVLAISALLFSVLIGLLAGYFPAKRAMNLSALEAIRTE